MDLVFTCESRFIKGADGKIYSPGGNFSLILWERYLSCFDRVTIIARVQNCQDRTFSALELAESGKVSFIELPYYEGIIDFLKKRKIIRKKIRENIKPAQAYILRVPGLMGGLLSSELKRKKIPYGVEVVGDPWGVFTPKSVWHLPQVLLRNYSSYYLRKIVQNASASIYVTRETLQKRYPSKRDAFTTYASNVNLPDNKVAENPKVFKKSKSDTINLISVGSLSRMYKSPDTVLEAVEILINKGYKLNLTWLGDGLYLEPMIKYRKKLNIESVVNFPGRITAGDAVRGYLKESDIFILVSRTEGLPRALIEAMATGLPCVGSQVGGIPELLEEDVLITPRNSSELANKIEFMISTPNYTNEAARKNLNRVQEYKESILSKKRNLFYNQLIEISDNKYKS